MNTELHCYFNNELFAPTECVIDFDDRIYATTDEYDDCWLISKGEKFDFIGCRKGEDVAVYAGKWNNGPAIKHQEEELELNFGYED